MRRQGDSCSLPGGPDFRTVSDGGLPAVADNGSTEQLRMFQQGFLLSLGRDVGHVERFIGPGFGIDERLKSNFLLDGLVLPGR